MNSLKANALHGIGFAVLATACFATLDTTTRHVSAGLSILVALWFRYAIQAVITTVVVWPGRGRKILRTQHPRFQLARGLLLFACSTLAFLSLKYMPVGEFTAVAFISPMIAMMLSGWLLKDHVSASQWWIAGLSFAGALIVIRPGAGIFGWAVLFPLALASVNALYQLVTRRLATADEHPVFSQWIGGFIGTVIMSVPLLWPGSWASNLSAAQWGILVSVGLLGTLGHFFFMKALAIETAAALAPYTYVQIGFAMAPGWLVFAHTPDAWAVAGMLVIGLSGFVSGVLRARSLAAPLHAR